MTEYTKADRVKLQEVIETLRLGDYTARTQLASEIQQHGIEVEYTPMTDAEWDAFFANPSGTDTPVHQDIEQAVLARLGIAPSLDQAKQICEQAGYAVVPNKASAQVCMTIMRGLQKGLNNGELYEAIIKMAKEVKP
jgi:hypothetical protein